MDDLGTLLAYIVIFAPIFLSTAIFGAYEEWRDEVELKRQQRHARRVSRNHIS